MIKRIILNASKIVWALAAISLFVGFFIGNQKDKNLKEQFINSADYKPLTENVFQKDSLFIGVFSAQGYGGEITAIVEVQDSLIQKVEIVKQSETLVYFEKCKDFILSFTGKKLGSNTQLVDAVSGATITSAAILEIIQKFECEYLSTSHPSKNKIHLSLSSALITLLICLSILAYFIQKEKLKKALRFILLFSSLLILGFWLNTPLTIANFAQLLTFKPLPLFSNIDIYLILIYALVSVIFTKRNSYCKNICPFGAFQDCAAYLLKPKSKISNLSQFNQLPLLLCGLALIPALLFQAPGLSLYEIYSGIFDFTLSLGLYAAFILTILLMLFVKRPWCRFLCPTGAVLNQILKLKNKLWLK